MNKTWGHLLKTGFSFGDGLGEDGICNKICFMGETMKMSQRTMM